jgi:hypothetical protein
VDPGFGSDTVGRKINSGPAKAAQIVESSCFVKSPEQGFQLCLEKVKQISITCMKIIEEQS